MSVPTPAQRYPATVARETLLDNALAAAVLGWPVFPLAPGQKVPLYANPHPKGSPERERCRHLGWDHCGRFGHGVLDATRDPRVIRHWWTRTPTANIGLACGRTPAGHGPDVVDFDVKDGAPGLVSWQRLCGAKLLAGSHARVDTPTGGWHLYFTGTNQDNGTLRGFGVDFRSAGGYVVAPTSRTPAGVYAWAEGPMFTEHTVSWRDLCDFLKPPAAPVEPVRRAVGTDARFLVEWLDAQGPGSENRNSGLFWACCKALEAGHGRPVLEELATVAARNGLGADEIRKTVDSATRRVLVGAHRGGGR